MANLGEATPIGRRGVVAAALVSVGVVALLLVLVPAALASLSVIWAIAAAFVAGLVLATAPKPADERFELSRRRRLWAVAGGTLLFGVAAMAVAQSSRFAGNLLPLYVAAAMLAAVVGVVATGPATRRQRMSVALAIALASTVVLGAPVVLPRLLPTACPAALWQGRLIGNGAGLDGLVPAAPVERFIWPFGDVVRGDRPTPDSGEAGVLTDLLGNEIARAGDTVSIGGGERTNGLWVACGSITVTKHATAPLP